MFAGPNQQRRGFSAAFHYPKRASVRPGSRCGCVKDPRPAVSGSRTLQEPACRQSCGAGRWGGHSWGWSAFGSFRRPAGCPGTPHLCAVLPGNKSRENTHISLSCASRLQSYLLGPVAVGTKREDCSFVHQLCFEQRLDARQTRQKSMLSWNEHSRSLSGQIWPGIWFCTDQKQRMLFAFLNG